MRQIHARNPDLGKSGLTRPAAKLVEHRCAEPGFAALHFRHRHLPIPESRIQHWRDEADCADSARALARHPRLREAFVELHGPLGAGKTTFARHLLQALGVTGRVKSPTYAVMEAYTAGDAAFEIFHFDFYRFDDAQEWEDAGFRDVFAGPGLKLAEWPEKAAELLPVADLSISIEPANDDEDARSVRLLAHTPLGQELLA